jgi:hypothetical protein
VAHEAFGPLCTNNPKSPGFAFTSPEARAAVVAGTRKVYFFILTVAPGFDEHMQVVAPEVQAPFAEAAKAKKRAAAAARRARNGGTSASKRRYLTVGQWAAVAAAVAAAEATASDGSVASAASPAHSAAAAVAGGGDGRGRSHSAAAAVDGGGGCCGGGGGSRRSKRPYSGGGAAAASAGSGGRAPSGVATAPAAAHRCGTDSTRMHSPGVFCIACGGTPGDDRRITGVLRLSLRLPHNTGL